MPVFVEVLFVTFTMIALFFLAFLVMFLLALFLSPIERELSKMVWSATSPPPSAPAKQRGSYRDFSKKHM